MINLKFPIIALAILLLFSATAIIAQTAPSKQQLAVFEIEHIYILDGGLQSHTTRIHVDGRLINEGDYKRKAKSGRYLKVSTKAEMQLEPEELAELVSWAEQPDFQNAKREYIIRILTDGGSPTLITYRNGGREKKIIVGNFFNSTAAERAKLPPSLLKLLEWDEKFPEK